MGIAIATKTSVATAAAANMAVTYVAMKTQFDIFHENLDNSITHVPPYPPPNWRCDSATTNSSLTGFSTAGFPIISTTAAVQTPNNTTKTNNF